jgi:hypothetical protein
LVLVSLSGQRWSWRGIESDADLLYCATIGHTERLIVSGCTSLCASGVPLTERSARVQFIEWAREQGAAKLASSEAIPIPDAYFERMLDNLGLQKIAAREES